MSDDVKRPWLVVVVTALIAAVPPCTAAVYGHVSKSRELEIAKQKQDYDIRVQFLDRAIDTTRSPEARHQVLRFLKTVMTDDAMRAWADQELVSVDQQLTAARAEAAAAKAALQKSRAEVAEKAREVTVAKSRLLSAQSSNIADKAKIAQLQADVLKAEGAQRYAEAELNASVKEHRLDSQVRDEIIQHADLRFAELDGGWAPYKPRLTVAKECKERSLTAVGGTTVNPADAMQTCERSFGDASINANGHAAIWNAIDPRTSDSVLCSCLFASRATR